jgi:hypothetical protein
MYYMAAPEDRYLMSQPMKPIIEKIYPDEKKDHRCIVIWYHTPQRRGVINSDIDTEGQKLHEYSCDLRANTTTEIGDSVIESVIRQPPDSGNKQLYPDQEKKYRYGIYNETHGYLNSKNTLIQRFDI